ncbi:hypothetical protein Ahy_B02g061162 isoform C [Arachis hypogaea]|uniref:Uncharacterized protein n=1 Tax=Arachis hypogaea TaxID=3818 RepID=A0A445AK91_ARAHY|nr:hypothetical protein Ahy_B02g061162 isoform C [Arachis hypogaea]
MKTKNVLSIYLLALIKLNHHEVPKSQTFSKEQGSNNGATQEIIATIKDEPRHHYNEHEQHFHLAPSMEERSNPQTHNDDDDEEPVEVEVEGRTSLELIMSCVIVMIHLPRFLLSWERWIGAQEVC